MFGGLGFTRIKAANVEVISTGHNTFAQDAARVIEAQAAERVAEQHAGAAPSAISLPGPSIQY